MCVMLPEGSPTGPLGFLFCAQSWHAFVNVLTLKTLGRPNPFQCMLIACVCVQFYNAC